jgi:hypothetical protein
LVVVVNLLLQLISMLAFAIWLYYLLSILINLLIFLLRGCLVPLTNV